MEVVGGEWRRTPLLAAAAPTTAVQEAIESLDLSKYESRSLAIEMPTESQGSVPPPACSRLAHGFVVRGASIAPTDQREFVGTTLRFSLTYMLLA